jgi:hypothetical protein
MTETTDTPKPANGSLRPESELSQVLAHGPAYSQSYGRGLGAFIMMLAIMKASRGPLGFAAAITLVCSIAYKIWIK